MKKRNTYLKYGIAIVAGVATAGIFEFFQLPETSGLMSRQPDDHHSIHLVVDRPSDDPSDDHHPIHLVVDRPSDDPSDDHHPIHLVVDRPSDDPSDDHHPVRELLFAEYDSALECMALNIYHESRGETIVGQQAVAWVTLNRMVHSRWPDTVCDVVWQRSQFSWTGDGLSDYPGDTQAYITAVNVAEDIMLNYYYYDDPTDGAVFYHANWVNPGWARRMELTVVIGVHLFYTL